MKSDSPTPSSIETIREQVRAKTPEGIIVILAIQLDRSTEAARRIVEEGIVVRDLKGSVISHPAIKIEIDAGKIMADLLAKYRV